MRALILILIIVIGAIAAAIMTGYVNITNIRGQPPQLTASPNRVTIKGGKPPAFEVEAGSVKVGTKDATIKVPTLTVQKPATNRTDPATNNGM